MAREIDVSVIVPAYNAAETIDDAIMSLRQQDFDGTLQIIAVDDGSADGTGQMITAHATKDQRILPILLSKNQGAANARNIGIEAAAGRFIAFLDHDDIAEPQRLQRQVAFMESNPSLTFSSTAVRFFGSENRVAVPSLDPDETAIRLMFSCEFFLPALIARASFLRSHHLYFEQGCWPNCDWEWVLKGLRAGGRIANLPDPLVRYRRWPRQMTSSIVDTPHCVATMIRLEHLCWLGIPVGECDMEAHIATARCHWPIRIDVHHDDLSKERIARWMRTIECANDRSRRYDPDALSFWLRRIAEDWPGWVRHPPSCETAVPL